jgi:ferric-dicitrate binding protein FerR (iron transport regulator)
MKDMQCADAREWIPLLASTELDPSVRQEAEAHVAACADCRREADLVALLMATRSEPPAGLSDSIRVAVGRGRRARSRPWWGFSAAAVAVLALGIGVLSSRDVSPIAVPVYAADTGEGGLWLSEDGLVAGAPALDGLSDEALEQLLSDLGSGGAA